MRDIPEKLLSLSTLISLGKSSGSGLLFSSKEFLYIISAKHVIYDEAGHLRINEIEVSCDTVNIDEDDVYRIQIDLSKVEHQYHKRNDVCAIKIGKLGTMVAEIINYTYAQGVTHVGTNYSLPGKTGIENISLLKDVYVPNNIYLFGYPTSLGIKKDPQFDYNKPLIRKGIVANVYKKQGTIILDCPTYPGNSGGPVLQVNVDTFGNKYFSVIGIVSQSIPYVQKWYNNSDKLVNEEHLNSGYSVITAMDSVIELISTMEKH